MLWSQVHEDCNLNNDCDQAGLIVCKYNRYVMTKRCLKPWLPQVFIWDTNSRLNLDNGVLPCAQSSGDRIIRCIRHACSPGRLDVIRLNDTKYDVIPMDDVRSQLLTKIRRTYHGKAHAVAFFDQSASEKFDMENYVDNIQQLKR